MSNENIARLARAALLPAFTGPVAPRWLLTELERGLGGVTLFAINGNVPRAEALAALTAQLRAAGDPLIGIDEEGGDVTRLGGHLTGSPYPGSAALGAVDDVALTRRVYRSLGAELAAAGVNLNFAPSADVNAADGNPIIGTRAFGADAELVARHTAAAVTGIQEAGVAACAKHFPGHGATVADSHLEVPLVEADLDLLDRRELAPFRAAIEADVQSIMTGHLNLPSITAGEPATLSYAAITGLLRQRLGYQGVIITDALDMKGASGAIGIAEACVRALRAGADLLCLGSKEQHDTVRAVVAAVVEAVRSGRLSEERLQEAADRTGRLRDWLTDQASPVTSTPATDDSTTGSLITGGQPTGGQTPDTQASSSPASSSQVSDSPASGSSHTLDSPTGGNQTSGSPASGSQSRGGPASDGPASGRQSSDGPAGGGPASGSQTGGGTARHGPASDGPASGSQASGGSASSIPASGGSASSIPASSSPASSIPASGGSASGSPASGSQTSDGLASDGLASGRQGGGRGGGGRRAVVDRAAGLEGARRALRLSGALPELGEPLVIELAAPGNIAVGPTPWGLSPWAPDLIRVNGDMTAAPLLERAKGRGLIVVVRDAHRNAEQRALLSELLRARPDAVMVEMGLPIWRPEGGVVHLATYGATAANGQAAAELLGLTDTV